MIDDKKIIKGEFDKLKDRLSNLAATYEVKVVLIMLLIK